MRSKVEERDHPGGYCNNPVERLWWLGQGGWDGDEVNELDFGHILKIEPRGFANRERLSYGRKRKRRQE